MSFIKFPSIKNSYEVGTINRWFSKFPEMRSSKYITTEKLDGSNFQIIITSDSVEVASRKQKLEITDSFFNFQKVVLGDCRNYIEALQEFIQKNKNGVKILHVYGEIFGNGIQKRIKYSDEKHFLPFEVRSNGEVLSIENALDLFESLGFKNWWVPIVGIFDSFEEALAVEINNVETKFPNENKKEDDYRNIEGIVIAPYNNVFKYDVVEDGIKTGEAVFRIKKKCKEFNDKMKTKHKETKDFVGSEEYNKLRNIWDGYFNENRLFDLFSKEGPIREMKDIGKYIKAMGNDVKEDFLNSHKEEFILLADDERKKIISSVGQNTVPLLTNYLQNENEIA